MHTGGGFWLRPRDMASPGRLMLDGGKRRGRRVVSEGWVRASVRMQVPYQWYGYQWWVRAFRGRDRRLDGFAAQGLCGQFVIVVPELKLEDVFTGWNPGPGGEVAVELFQRHVLPAVTDGPAGAGRCPGPLLGPRAERDAIRTV